MKTMTVGVRMTPEMRDKLKEIADKEMRTLSNLILKILTEYLMSEEDSEENEK
jgi:predicted DNA-binding protein